MNQQDNSTPSIKTASAPSAFASALVALGSIFKGSSDRERADQYLQESTSIADLEERMRSMERQNSGRQGRSY